MTTIIGYTDPQTNDTYLAADRLSSSNNAVICYKRKIFIKGNWMWANSGLGLADIGLNKSISEDPCTIDELNSKFHGWAEEVGWTGDPNHKSDGMHLKSFNGLFVDSDSGQMYSLYSNKDYIAPQPGTIHNIGSGGLEARASLATALHMDCEDIPTSMWFAVSVACKYDLPSSPPIDVFRWTSNTKQFECVIDGAGSYI